MPNAGARILATDTARWYYPGVAVDGADGHRQRHVHAHHLQRRTTWTPWASTTR
jgi:hypothetical protein